MQKSIAKNVIFKFILNIFNIIVPIIVGPYILRKLGPELMGVINYSQAIFAYFFIFAGFGVYQYGLREISKVRENKEKLSVIFTSLFVLTIITNIITTISYFIYISFNFNETAMYSVSLILSFNFISNIFYTEWINEAIENYDFITIKTVIIRIIYVIVLIGIVKESKDFTTYIALTVLSTFFNNIVSFFYIKRHINFNFKKIQIKRHIKPMALVVILSNANVLYTQLDKVMLGEYVGIRSVAFYTMAQNISYMINAMLLSLVHVSIPRLSNYIGNNMKIKYEELLNKVSKIYLIILFPAAIGLIVLAKEVVFIYGGQEYMEAYPLLILFSIYIITLGYEAIFSNQIMYVNGIEKKQVKIIIYGGVCNLILNIVLLFSGIFTPVNSIITTILANIFVIVIQHIYVRKKLDINYNIFAFDKSKYALLAMVFIPVSSIIRMFEYNMITNIILIICINMIIYFGALFYTKDKIFMEIIKKIKNKFIKNKV